MNIIRAKTAGFCFGVDRAVKLTYDLLADGHKVATLGPLIHNPQVVEDLEAKGALTCPDVASVPDGYEVVIRSHGVPQTVYDEISTRRLAYHDATCPFVAKIHKIAMRADENHALLLVAGDASHPEVQGIVGHTKGKVKVFANLEELEKNPPAEKLPAWIKTLSDVRKKHPAARTGRYRELMLTNRQYAFARLDETDALITAVNNDENQSAGVWIPASCDGTWKNSVTGEAISPENGKLFVEVPPCGCVLIEKES